MERARIVIAIGIALVLVALPKLGTAEVLMAPDSPAAKKESDQNQTKQYGESAFGKPPAPVDLGVARKFVDEEDQERSSRAPASVNAEGKAIPHNNPGTEEVDQLTKKYGGVQEVALIANELGYYPKVLFVHRDIPVRLFVTGASKNNLCIMMDTFQIRKQIRSQKVEEVEFTPSSSGKFRFYCPINGMEGTMVVKDIVSR